jgi:hypothetical protein
MPVNDQTPDVTLVDPNGGEVGTLASPLFTQEATVGTLNAGAQVAFGAAQGSILAANANRKAVIVQNISATAACRVGVTGVTNATGIQVVAGATLILEMPYCPTAELFAIREAAVSGTVLVTEIT